MSKILELKAEEVLDSRGSPTVSCTCMLESGGIASASIPSGASTGAHEAHELRDGDMTVHKGKGVQKVLENINTEINYFFKGKDWDQKSLDKALVTLDGTANKSRLGANAMLAVSLAFARACATEQRVELFEYISNIVQNKNPETSLPTPAFNIINGGKHADSGIDFQEFMIIPVGFETFTEKVTAGDKIIKSLHQILLDDEYEIHLGDEGGFAPKLATNAEALHYLTKAIISAGYNTEQVKLGIDVAANSFFVNGKYKFEEKELSSEGMLGVYEKLVAEYPIISIEDPFEEEDFAGYATLNAKIGTEVNIVGDDLTVTNISRLQKAVDEKSLNTILIKPNQIGTLSETLETIKLAKENNIKTFISHRSGETMDTFIADLAVGTGAQFIKAGSLTRPERIAKYQRLIEIERQLTV